MPLYEFVCDDCGTPFEELVTGDRKVDCPRCGSAEVRKQFSTFSAGRSSGSSPSWCPSAPAPT